MSDLDYARFQMAISLGFHIVFAAIGIAMPLLMVAAEWRWLKTGQSVYRDLAKNWAKGTAVFFAVGAVSGTVLSFELGLLWPKFMEHAGGIIGFPFSLEGFAFFTEAIFLGIYLYAWTQTSRWMHLFAGVVVAISGAASAFFVIMVNGWMNAPTGFDFDPATGTFSNIDPVAAMFNPAWRTQAIHMVVAAYLATAFGAAGIHAFRLLRDSRSEFHRRALSICMTVGVTAAILQPITGDRSAKMVARTQPVKLAALEGQFETQSGAPFRLGGLPDETTKRTKYALEIPGVLSFLAHGSFNATVQGLDSVPETDWPPVAVVHIAFQVMVLLGLVLVGVSAWFCIAAWRVRGIPTTSRYLLWALVICSPLGFIAIEAGWIVTEVGRQPWIIYGVMRTKDAVTTMPGLAIPAITFTLVYLFLSAVVFLVLRHQVRGAEAKGPAEHAA